MKKNSVIIIDDNIGHRNAIQFLLEKEDYTVHAARSGELGLNLLKEIPDIKVLVVDLAMLGMSGVDVLKAIKDWKKPLRRIVLTAHDEELSSAEAERLKVFAYLNKPISKHTLIFTVKSAFNDFFLEHTQQELSIAKQWEELGQLTADFVHVVGNKVGIIPNYIDTVKEDIEDIPPKVNEKFNNILDISRHIHSLKDILLTPFKRSEMQKESVTEIMTTVLTEKVIPEDVKINRKFEKEALYVYVNRSEMQKVFEELLTNAVDAMTESETKEITLSTHNSNGSIDIKILDTGCGIKEELVRDVFRAFITTKGTEHYGLGLFSIKNTLAKFDGTIKCSSIYKKGTTFEINLPAV